RGTGDEQVTICYKKDTIVVKQSELQSYFDRGAITGECSNIVNDAKVDICHGGNTITIDESALQAHLDQGDTLGACPNDPLLGGSTGVDELRDLIASEDQKGKFEVASIVGAAAGVTAMIAAMLLPLLAAMPGTFSGSLFLRIAELFGIIGKRKEDQNWGIVFDADTRMPLVAVKIVLSDQFGKELATTYSNKDGRFGFLADPGTYVIHVFKKGYTLFTDKSNDELYGNVYDGKTITIDSDHVILTNLSMKSEITDWQGYSGKKIRQYKTAVFMKYVFFAIYVLGFGATIMITIFYPSIFNFIVLSIYVVLLGYQLLSEKKKYGSIETNTGDPVPFAVVNLYDQESQAKHNFAVTDATGRYYLLADNGAYNLKAKGQPVSGTQFEKHGEVDVNDGIVRKDIVV
ncbi:MAG: carboxypeptidase-like regulatory domain-containing protein, partial [Patescibacteria group bacterium]|nr:carboxypeptidase-like regulatory domain-containing protein [Patescibacteria group bacterium]